MKKIFLKTALLSLAIAASAHANEIIERKYVGVSDVDSSRECSLTLRTEGKKVTGVDLNMQVINSDEGVIGYSLWEYSNHFDMLQIGRVGGNLNLSSVERSCMAGVLCTTITRKVSIDFNGENIEKLTLKHASQGNFGIGRFTDKGTCSGLKLEK